MSNRACFWFVLSIVVGCEDAADTKPRDASVRYDASASRDASAAHDSGTDGAVRVFDSGEHEGDATVSPRDAATADAEIDAQPELQRAELASLVPSAGVLVPAFQPDVTEYVLELPLTAARAALVLTAVDGAVARIAGSVVASGEVWSSDALANADTTVAVTVEQPGRRSSSYTLTLRKTNLPQVLRTRTHASELGMRVAVSQDTLVLAGMSGDGHALIEIWERAEHAWTYAQSLGASECALAAPRVSLAFEGDVIVLGCGGEQPGQRGSAYVFTREGSSWSGPTRLRADDGLDGDYFGESVAVSGDWLVVGAPLASLSDGQGGTLDQAGSVYVFKRGAGSWEQQVRLRADNAGALDGFGAAVAVHGTTLAASAPLQEDGTDEDATDSGAAYVFVLDGDAWVQQAYLKAARPDPSILPQQGGDQFGGGDSLAGRGVALWEDTLAVGAGGEDIVRDATADAPELRYAPDVGAVYIFKRQAGAWSQQQRLMPSVLSAGSQFGSAIALWGDRLVVGAWQHRGVGAGLNAALPAADESAGAAFSFVRSGADYVEAGRLGAAQPAAFARFGWSVAVSEHATAVGAPGSSAREVYLFP